MNRESLLEQVDAWARVAAVVASYARGDSKREFMTPAEMSQFLQLRWFMFSGRIVVAIEHNRDKVIGDYWLGSFSVGGIDPYVLGFRRVDSLTDDDMAAAEEVVRVAFPQIAVVRCHTCEGYVVSDNIEGEWVCRDCLELLPEKTDTFGYVYIFGSEEEGRYKIGQSNSPKARLNEYRRSKLPFSVEMIHTIPADDKVKAEADLHRRLRDKRESGEWFRLSPDELRQITSIKAYNAGLWLMQ